MHINLEGLKKFAWKKNLYGYFTIENRKLSDAETRKLVIYGLQKGYKTDDDFTDDDLHNLFAIK